jgi:peptide deformylase
MTKRTILEYPDSRLRTKATIVNAVDGNIKNLVNDMYETMYSAPGIGLAATQINVHKRILVADISQDKSEPYCFINPEIIEREGEVSSEEGCLSVPGFYVSVSRSEKVKVKALDENGNPFELALDNLLSICVQHEIDHLDGKLFVDYLSPLKRERLRKKILKINKHEQVSRARENASVL